MYPSYTDTGPPFLYGDSDTPPHLVAFYDTLGIRRMYSRLKPPAASRGRVSSWLISDEGDKHKLNLCSAKRAAMSTILLHNRCVKNGICVCDIFLEFGRVRIQNHILWLYVFVSCSETATQSPLLANSECKERHSALLWVCVCVCFPIKKSHQWFLSRRWIDFIFPEIGENMPDVYYFSTY